MKRLLDCDTSDLKRMNKQERLQAIEASEGRILVQELSLFYNSRLLPPVSDAEVACAFGADLILLNAFDCTKPHVEGIDAKPEDVVHTLKRYTGRLMGLNLEPIGDSDMVSTQVETPIGRQATIENAMKAKELGFDFIVLTGNPGSGVDNGAIEQAIQSLSNAVGDDLMIIAGKMHAAGSKEEAGNRILSDDWIQRFIQAGADVLLCPAPGTVPGLSLETVSRWVEVAHAHGALTLTAIGTSQESAEPSTIEKIALQCKMTGTDMHHIGDAGLGGINPENLMMYSKAIRGKRHTYLRMARSINR